MFSFKQLLRAEDISALDIKEIFALADRFKDASRHGFEKVLEGKILAALFFEPSTRTRLSTETAMRRLGGDVITVVGTADSSISKGETLYDTGKVINSFADIIAMRHPDKGSVAELASVCDVPVINCGDGPGDHPTQALLDLYTIYSHYGKLDGLKIAMVGDLKYGRTVHSLLKLLGFYQVELVFVAPDSLQMPEEYLTFAEQNNLSFRKTNDLEDGVKDCDVVYMTRIQKERFQDIAEYEALKGVYVLTKKIALSLFPNGVLLHPLPRIDEIDVDCDDWPGSLYFEQVKNGVTVRMALIYGLLKGN